MEQLSCAPDWPHQHHLLQVQHALPLRQHRQPPSHADRLAPHHPRKRLESRHLPRHHAGEALVPVSLSRGSWGWGERLREASEDVGWHEDITHGAAALGVDARAGGVGRPQAHDEGVGEAGDGEGGAGAEGDVEGGGHGGRELPDAAATQERARGGSHEPAGWRER